MAGKFLDEPINTQQGGNFIEDKQGLSVGQKLGASGVGVAQGISDVGQNIVGGAIGKLGQKIGKRLEGSKIQTAIQSGAKKLFGEQALKDFQTSEKEKRLFSDYNPAKSNIITDTNLLNQEQQQSGFASGGREVGKFIGTTALTMPLGGIVGVAAKGAGALGRIGVGALQGAVQTQASNLASEGKLATVGETLLGAGIGGGLQGVGELGKGIKNKLYNSAFSQAKDSTKKQIAEYGQTAGKAVQEQKLSPSVKKGLVEIKDKLGNTWKAINDTANKAGDVDGIIVRGSLKDDLIKKLGYDKLNQNAQSTKDLIEKLGGVIDDMIPQGKIKPSEIVNQIKQINGTLGNTLVGKGFQDLKGNAKIQKVITTGLKNTLDKVVEKGGGGAGVIQKLYQQYGKEKVVQSMLKDEQVRKTLGRQLVGAAGGGTIGAIAGYEDFKEGNILQGLAKVATFSVGGAAVSKLAKNPTFLMKLANVAEKALGKFSKGKTISSYLASKTKK